MIKTKSRKGKAKRVSAKDILEEQTVKRKSLLDSNQTQKGILDKLLFQRKIGSTAETKKKTGWVGWIEKIELLLILIFFWQLISGNGATGINILVIWGLLRVFRVIFQTYLGDRSEDLNLTLTGVGAFTLGLFALSGSFAVYSLDGTQSCTEPFIGSINDDNSVLVYLTDLNVRTETNGRSWIGVTTKIIADGNYSCVDCSIGPYPKPDGNPDEKERFIQHTTTKVTFQKEVKNFLFIQQARFWEESLPILSDASVPIRACECKIGFNGVADCKNRVLIEWILPAPFPAIYSIDFNSQTRWLMFLGTKFFHEK